MRYIFKILNEEYIFLIIQFIYIKYYLKFFKLILYTYINK